MNLLPKKQSYNIPLIPLRGFNVSSISNQTKGFVTVVRLGCLLWHVQKLHEFGCLGGEFCQDFAQTSQPFATLGFQAPSDASPRKKHNWPKRHKKCGWEMKKSSLSPRSEKQINATRTCFKCQKYRRGQLLCCRLKGAIETRPGLVLGPRVPSSQASSRKILRLTPRMVPRYLEAQHLPTPNEVKDMTI